MFCKSKKLSIHSELAEGSIANVQQMDLDESESEDEDFVAGKSDSDVNEEYDEDYRSDGEESDKNEKTSKRKGSDQSQSESESEDEAPKKKQKSSESNPKSEKEKKSKSNPKPEKETKSKSNVKPDKKKKKEGPKRPMTSFLYFSNAKRPEIKDQFPGMSIGEVGKKMGEMWKEASPEDKKIYEDMASKDKERYQTEMSIFKETGSLTKSKHSNLNISKQNIKESPNQNKELSNEFVDSDDENL